MKRRIQGVWGRLAVLLQVLAIMANGVCAAATSPTSSVVASNVDTAVAGIDALRNAAKFIEARDEVRKAIQQYAAEADVKKLRDMEIRIRDQVRDFIKMKADIEQLSSEDPVSRKVAVEHLLGDDVGKIVLRQTVRDGAAGAALAAGRGLAEIKDNIGVQAVLARAKTENDVATATALIAILTDVSKAVPLAELLTFATWASDKPASAYTPVKEIMKRRAVGPLNPVEVKAIAETAAGPDSPARRGAFDFLSIVFRSTAKRDVDAFNKIVGEDIHANLLAALEKDRAAEDKQLAKWATQKRLAMLRIDHEAMSKGLHARWTLDTLGHNQFNDSGPSSRNLGVKGVDSRQIVPGILGKALALTNDTAQLEWGDRAYRQLQTNDFSLSAWVRVFKTRPNFNDVESVVLGTDVNNGRTGGLILGTNGIVHFYLPVMVQPEPTDANKKPGKKTLDYIKTSAANPLVTNLWYHLAAAVSWTSGEVTLFVNGEISGRASITNNASPSDVGTLKVGACRSQTKDRRVANCLQGLIDDIRVYNRPITETDAAILFAEGDM